MAQASNYYRAYLSVKLEAGGSETTVYVDRMTNMLGETISFSDFADFGRGILTVNPDGDGLASYPENISFTGISGNTFTGCTRGLSAKSDTPSTSNARFHPVGTPVVISFGAHNIQDLVDYVDDSIGAVTVGVGSAATATAGETITAGQLVYLNTDGKWWKTDADTAATVQGVQLGIAQGAGTANNAITNGVLLRGRDSNQTGLTAGTDYYASNTAGGISSSPGTTPRLIGRALSANAILFDPYSQYTLTDDQQDALAGTATPSALNKFVTQNNNMTAGATINGATTPVPVYQNSTDFEVYAADANDTNALGFIGFAVSNSTDGNSIRVQTSGIVSGFTGLTRGKKYYVQDTAGTIGTTIGTYEVLVGWAISTTEILIMKGLRRATGTISSLGTASSSSAVTCGFRPSVIRLTAYAADSNSISHMAAVWVNGSITGVYTVILVSTSGEAGVGAILYDGAVVNNNYMTFTITSVTDTGFTITWTETGTFSVGGSTCIWEAESEL